MGGQLLLSLLGRARQRRRHHEDQAEEPVFVIEQHIDRHITYKKHRNAMFPV